MPDGATLAAEVASRGQYLFDVDEFRRLPVRDALRLELIEGVVIPMSPVGPAHYSVTYLLEQALRSGVEPEYRVRVESSVQLGARTQVQPDLSVITARDDGYRRRLPGPGDIMLLVEVADTSLSRDRGDKVPLYALHSIPEMWIVNVKERTVAVYYDPADGRYRFDNVVGMQGVLSPLVAPDLKIKVASLFAEDE